MKDKYFITTSILLSALIGCKSAKVIQMPVNTVERITERLVPVEVPADSAILTALFYCDSLNEVRLAEIGELKSRRMDTGLQFAGGALNYRALTVPDTVYLPSRTIEIEREVPVTVEVPRVEYRQTKLQRLFFYTGIIATVFAAAWLGFKLKSGGLLKIISKSFKQ